MDWSRMFAADVVVFGCGNVLFGDDGLGPLAMAELAAAPDAATAFGHAAFIDAGTSIRPLLLDLTLCGARPRRVVLVDVVQEPEREPGSLREEDLDAHPEADPAGGFLHHAPTWGLLRRLRDEAGTEVIVLTVQAGRIPELMDDALSPEARAALPRVVRRVRELCCLQAE